MLKYHPFHIVNKSSYPFWSALSIFFFVFGIVQYMHGYNTKFILLIIGVYMLILNMYYWWNTVIHEGLFEKAHTNEVIKGLSIGIILFIVSEIMFFSGFFWAFFHSSLSPTIWIGCIWPPKGIVVFNALGIPLLNTFLLLVSGSAITLAHYKFIYHGQLLMYKLGKKDNYSSCNQKEEIYNPFFCTLILAVLFTLFQGYEYKIAPFSISDGIYGSTFYMLTGFHGFHVLIGTIFLFICLIRYHYNHFNLKDHLGLQGAIWYWHFVDGIWILLYLSIYVWGNIQSGEVILL